jgi:hypothetical protein
VKTIDVPDHEQQVSRREYPKDNAVGTSEYSVQGKATREGVEQSDIEDCVMYGLRDTTRRGNG